MRRAAVVWLCLSGCAGNATATAAPSAAAPRRPAAAAASSAARGSFDSELRAVLAERDGACSSAILALVQRDMAGLRNSREVFPHVGRLRERLLACQTHPQWTAEDHRRLSAAKWARMWLAMWGDPADDEIVERFLSERSKFAHRESGVEAKSAHEAMAKWVEQHFTREGFPDPGKRTAHGWDLVVPEQGGRALGLFHVHYQHWGYAIQVVLVERDARWRARISLHAESWHFD